MANMLSQSTSPRSVFAAGDGGAGPQSGVDYFGSVGQRTNVSLNRPSPPRASSRASRPNPGAQSIDSADRMAPTAVTERPMTEFVDPTGGNRDQSLTQLGPGERPLVDPGTLGSAFRTAGLVPGLQGLSFVGSLLSAADRDADSMAKTGERDLSGMVSLALGMGGMSPLGIAATRTAYDATRRYTDDDPANDPGLRTYAPTMARAVVDQYAGEDARRAVAIMDSLRSAPAQEQPAPGVAQRVDVALNPPAPPPAPRPPRTQAPPDQSPDQAPGGQPGAGGFDNPGFNPDNPTTVDALQSVRDFEDAWGMRDTGGGWGGGRSDGRGTSNSAHGGDAQAARGGMATRRGFSRPRGYAMGGEVSMGVPPAAGDAQSPMGTVQRMLRDPAATQRLLALPLSLMQSGQLTPDEVMTMGRVAEAAMYNPALYPQLRAFVAEQGMTPLPPAFDQSVITNIIVIAKALQAQMPATPPGQVPPTGQAQIEQPVPGFGNGGYIRGPGTGTSDSIGTVNEQSGAPVKVATDEYVIPAHVVRAKGREFFDNLLRRYDPSQNGGQHG